MTSKPTKLLSFARTSGRGAVAPPPEPTVTEEAPASSQGPPTAKPAADLEKKRSRVATNLRLTRDQWRRVHELALDEETSVQELAIRGLSRLFEDRGLPRL